MSSRLETRKVLPHGSSTAVDANVRFAARSDDRQAVAGSHDKSTLDVSCGESRRLSAPLH